MHLPTWTRIALSYALLVILTGTVLGFLLSQDFERREEDGLRARLVDQAHAVAYSAYPLFASGVSPQTVDKLADDLAKVFGTRVTLIKPDGIVVGDSEQDPSQMENHANRTEVQQVLADPAEPGTSSRLSATVNNRLLYVAVAIRPPGGQGPALGVARVAYPTASIEEARNALFGSVALVVLLVSLPAAIVGVLLPRAIARQLAALRDTAQRFGRGDLSARAPQGTVGEVRDLGHEFNAMADQLEETIEQRTSERNEVAAVFAHMQDGLVITDGAGRVRAVNLAASHLFGMSPDAAVGRSLIELTHDYELHSALRGILDRAGEPKEFEVRVGDQLVVAAVTAVPGTDGVPPAGLVVLHNVTELRKLERVRSDFVANIGHELRTPLASVKLLAETLSNVLHDDPAAADEFLRRISVEVDGLTQLVRELLELSRIESGQVQLRRMPVDVKQLLARVEDRLNTLAGRAGVVMKVEAGESLPPAFADPERIEQVLVNLAHNAIKFTMPGGSVTLKAERYGGGLLLSVSDTGVGIPPEDLPRIFERFYKVDKARTSSRDREGGTGLGLAIAKHLVQAHGGQIWAESVVEKGATFHFTLPIAASVPQEALPA